MTSYTVKAAMLRDLGSRDIEFVNVIKEVRSGTLKLANVTEKDFTMIPMQGSGTFGVEAVLSSVVSKNGPNNKLLIIANGAYGLRMEKIAKAHNIGYYLLSYNDDTAPSMKDIEEQLKQHKDISHVAVVHSETTSGIINDIQAIGQLVHKYNKSYIVDAMSSFGAVPIDVEASHIDYLVSSSNKCVQGVPGFSFIIARRSALANTKGNARTLSLDIHDQANGLDTNGQFRFTPPTHALIAFRQALRELQEEGGVLARHKRYMENRDTLDDGMRAMGFQGYLTPHLQGPIITTYKTPSDKNWDFAKFYNALNERDVVIYPGKVTNSDSFRIGHIGHLFPQDTRVLLKHIADVVKEMGMKLK